jgi:hypothetical protein
MTSAPFSHIPLPLSVQRAMMETNVWTTDCPVSLSRLSLVQFEHHDFQGTVHYDGSLVVLDVLAPHVENIMRHLFLKRFPIHSAKRIELFEGSDEASMSINNSSAFNFRSIAGTNRVSLHGYGAAIDLNPVQNPCLANPRVVDDESYSIVEVWPETGTAYLNRSNQRPGMTESIVDLFAENGFREWGGSWDHKPDYHHFQVTRPMVELLAKMTKDHGDAFFRAYVHYKDIGPLHEGIVNDYQDDPEKFMKERLGS